MTFEGERQWQRLYIEALVETDVSRLIARVAAAEKAMCVRAEELRMSPDRRAESQAIADAMSGLSVLKREVESEMAGTKSKGIEPEQASASPN